MTNQGLSPSKKRLFFVLLYVTMAVASIGGYLLLTKVRKGSAGNYGAKLREEMDPYKKATFLVPVPFTGFHCFPNIRSDAVNTNDIGLRGTLDYLDMVKAAADLKAQGYKIGIFVGGSAAFGYFSTNDAKTIPGVLNSIAEARGYKAHIFNFAVSSYTSDQELVSLVVYAAALNPDLLIVMDGHNDILHATYEAPPGREGEAYSIGAGIDYGFPRIRAMYAAQTGLTFESKYLDRVYDVRDNSPLIPEHALNETLENYRKNLASMARYMRGTNGRVIFAPQPVLGVHNSPATPAINSPYLMKVHRVYSRLVDIAKVTALVEQQTFVDIVTVFETLPPETTVFLDKVHMNDLGQQLVAMKLWPAIVQVLTGER